MKKSKLKDYAKKTSNYLSSFDKWGTPLNFNYQGAGNY